MLSHARATNLVHYIMYVACLYMYYYDIGAFQAAWYLHVTLATYVYVHCSIFWYLHKYVLRLLTTNTVT